MKIAILVERLGSQHGGLERDYENFSLGMKEKGHTIHIFTASWEVRQEELIYHKISYPTFPAWLKPYAYAKSVDKQIKEKDFDLVISSGKTLTHDILRNIGVHRFARQQNLRGYHSKFLRFVKTIHYVLSLKEKLTLFVEKKSFLNQKNLFIIANSNLSKSQIMNTYNIPSDKIFVIYNGVDTNRFHPKNRILFGDNIRKKLKIEESFVIGFVANNFRLKGLRSLFDALSLVESRNWKLLILGKGHTIKYLQLAQRMKIKDHVIFAGIQDHPEQYYGAMDFLIHPTYYDPFSNVVLEAMSSGIPVITTLFNGASEIITGKEGFILPNPDDRRFFADQIRLMFDKNFREQMGRKARLLAEKYTLENNIRKFLSFFTLN